MKELKLGEDDELIAKYASKWYLQHLHSKEGVGALLLDQMLAEKSDDLYAAAKSYGESKSIHTTQPPKKEKGVSIQVGRGYQTEEAPKDDATKAG